MRTIPARFGMLLVTILIGLVFSLTVAAQVNSTVGGSVEDTAKALIPGVTITATNIQTGVVNTTLTNESGSYNFPVLAPGSYRIKAELAGFNSKTVSSIELGAGVSSRQNFVLEIATTGTSVNVEVATDSLLATSSASIGEVLNADRIANLPLVGNNILDLVRILPGYRQGPGGLLGAQLDTFAGTAASSVNTTRDGISVTDGRFINGVFSTTNINPDLVGEVRLILAPVDAEQGRGNAQIQIQTRSGTNAYTGSAAWYVRNTALNPNTWANNRTGAKPILFAELPPSFRISNELVEIEAVRQHPPLRFGHDPFDARPARLAASGAHEEDHRRVAGSPEGPFAEPSIHREVHADHDRQGAELPQILGHWIQILFVGMNELNAVALHQPPQFPQRRQQAAQQVNRKLAQYVDVMLGNEEDFTSALGFAVEGVDEHLSELDTGNFRRMIETVVAKYPNLQVVATTLRNAKTATVNDWSAICYGTGSFFQAPRIANLEIFDRVGGGDSFASGLIYGFLSGKDAQWAVECGCAHGALAMTTPGDTSMATLSEVLRVMKGGTARVQR
jgi:hypothetical protein